MSFGGSVRTGIEFDISAPGAGLVDDVARQIEMLKNSLEGVQNMYADGSITVREYIGQTGNLGKQLKNLQASFDQIVAGIAASHAAIANSGQGMAAWGAVVQGATQTGRDYVQQLTDMAALQARLGQMEERTAREAAEARAAAINAEQAAEESAYQDTLQRLQKRQQAEHQANAQIQRDSAAAAAQYAATILKREQDEIAAIRATEELYANQAAQKIKTDQATIEAQIQAHEKVRAATDSLRSAEDQLANATSRANIARMTAREREEALLISEAKAAAADENLARARDHLAVATEIYNKAITNASDATAKYGATSSQADKANQDLIGTASRYATIVASTADASNAATRANQNVAQAQRDLRSGIDLSNQSFAHWTRTVFFAAQGIEDMQYSFAAVANNVPLVVNELSRAIGANTTAAMGWAAGISLATTAITVMLPKIQNWIDQKPGLKAFFDELTVQLNPFHVERFTAEIDTLNARIKELEGRKVRLAVDDSELTRAKGRVDEFNEAWKAYQESVTGKSDAERVSGQTVTKILAEAPGGEKDIAETLGKQFGTNFYETSVAKRELDARSQRNQNRLDYAKKQGTYDSLTQERFDKENAKILNERNRLRNSFIVGDKSAGKVAAGDIISKAKGGDADAIEQLAGLTGNRQGANPIDVLGFVGPSDLAGQLRSVTPDAIRQEKEHEREIPSLQSQSKERERVNKEQERDDEATRLKQIADEKKGIDQTAHLFRPKLQDEIDLRAAQMVKDGKSDDEVKKAIDSFVRTRLTQANVSSARMEGSVNNPGAVAVLTSEAMDRFNARLGGRAGADSRGEAAAEIKTEIEAKRAKPGNQEQTKHEQQIAELARKNAVAVEGKNQDLTRFINERLGDGDTPEQIVKRLAPQAGQRLAKVPGMDPALIADAAEKIVRDVIEKQAPLIIAEGGGADGAAALNANLAGRNFDRINRGNAAEQRRDFQSNANEATDIFASNGFNAQQSLALGHKTAELVKGGLDFDRALMQAYADLSGMTRAMRQQQTQMMHQLQRAIRQMNRRPGGNNRPART